ncbi:MAG: hypothetical protein HXY25_01060 [Alphaproteobacteria bacterium]|nr:hypothetical protein [Alphaproteobacteria bacterium]
MSLILRLVFVVLLLGAVALGVFYFRYGTLDTCRALAIEQTEDADRALEENFGIEVRDPIERLNRALTSQMTSRECFDELVKEWTGDEP